MALTGYKSWAVNSAGNIVPSAAVEVRRKADNSLASLFTDAGGGTPVSNPFAAGLDGSFEFYADPDRYDLLVGTGPSQVTVPVDLADGRAHVPFEDTAAFVAWVSGGGTAADGTIKSDGERLYIASSGATDLTGLPGWLPFGSMEVEDFADIAGVTSAQVPVGGSLIVTSLGATYERAPDAATDEHLDYSGSGGVKWYVVPCNNGYNVKHFGAVGDNVTDDSAAFIAAVTASFDGRQTVGTAPNPYITSRVFLPSTDGGYLLSQPESLIPNLGTSRASGLTVEGESRGTVIRVGFTSDNYLAYNNNQFLQVLFRNLSFDANGASVKFLFSTANGGAQDYIFENCFWSGTWEKLWVLRGADNNSEWRFNSCGMNAYVQDVAMDVADSDQFLNYWHVNCKWWLREGQFLRASAGGHHHFINCDFSGLDPTMANNTSTNGAFMFELTGRAHARGTCVFVMRDCRFEHKVPASKLIYCEWNQGSVLFDNCDFNSNLYADDAAPNTEHARFDFENTRGPVVSWESCSLQGQHVYRYGVNAWQQDHRVKYDGCQIAWGEINDLIKVEANTTGVGAHGNFGGAPLITVDNSVVEPWYADGTPDVISNFKTVCFDADINGSSSRSSSSKVRQFVMRNPQGGGTPTTTSGDFTLTMPQNVIITRVTWVNDGSLSSVVVPDFQLKDGSGSVISSQSAALNVAAIVEDPVHYNIGTDNVLTLSDANAVANQSGPGVYCLIEYMGG